MLLIGRAIKIGILFLRPNEDPYNEDSARDYLVSSDSVHYFQSDKNSTERLNRAFIWAKEKYPAEEVKIVHLYESNI